eukprot:724698-Pleurochrysis_carterae.AAC.2
MSRLLDARVRHGVVVASRSQLNAASSDTVGRVVAAMTRLTSLSAVSIAKCKGSTAIDAVCGKTARRIEAGRKDGKCVRTATGRTE